MSVMRKVRWPGLMLAAMLLASACGAQPPAPESSTTQTGSSNQKEIDRPLFLPTEELRPSAGEWNPLWANNFAQIAMFNQVWMGIGNLDPDANLLPWLEKEASMSPDCMKASIKLYPNARWTDGKPLTAQDIEFTLRLRLRKELSLANPTSGDALGAIVGTKDFYEGKTDKLVGVKVVDDQTIELTFDSKQCLFFTLSGLKGIQPKHMLESYWDNIMAAPYWKNPTVTSGPYKFIKLENDNYVELERWEEWWGKEIYGKPKIKKVFFKQVRDPQVQASQLQAGELHVGKIETSELERFEKLPNVVIYQRPTLGISAYGLNARTFPDPRTRQALAYALDMQEIIQLAHDGLADVTATTVVGPAWAKNPDVKPFQKETARAKQLLQASGFDTGKKLRFISSNAADKRPELFQAAMKEVGLTVDIQVLSPAVWRDKLAAGEWDVHAVSGGVFGSDPAINCNYYESSVVYAKVRMGYKNDRIDQLCAGLTGSAEKNERQKLAHELDKVLQDDMPWITIGVVKSIYVADKRVGGYVPSVYHSGDQVDSVIHWYWKE